MKNVKKKLKKPALKTNKNQFQLGLFPNLSIFNRFFSPLFPFREDEKKKTCIKFQSLRNGVAWNASR